MSKKRPPPPSTSPASRIIVLGAGVSGLACARELQQRGFDVLVVEARSRVGGRLKAESIQLSADTTAADDAKTTTTTVTQYPIDVGGALIHGVEDNPIQQITDEMGVPTHDISDNCLLLDQNGWPFEPTVDDKMSQFFNACLDATFARAEQNRDSAESFGDLFQTVCREKQSQIGRGGLASSRTAASQGIEDDPLLQWHRANLELPSGASFFNLGYTWNEDEPYGFDGAHAAPETGWAFVMEHLAKGLSILDGSPVTSIRVVLPDGRSSPEHLEVLDHAAAAAAATHGKSEESDSATTTASIDGIRLEVESERSTSGESSGDGDGPSEQIDPNVLPYARDAAFLDKNTPEAAARRLSGTVASIERSSASSRTTKRSHVVDVNGTSSGTKRKRSSIASPLPPPPQAELQPTRLSRRIRGEEANVRRSSRSTKGVIQFLTVGHEFSSCYDDPSRKTFSQNRKGKRLKKKKKAKDLRIDEENYEDDEQDPSPESKVQVTLKNGIVLEADALVCTLPLGVLKTPKHEMGHVRFIPSLPPSKLDAIEKLGCGLLNKCVLSFHASFWPDSDFLGLAGTEHSYLVLNAMKYTKKPILIFMFGGDFAREVEDWSDADVVADCLSVLKKICSKCVHEPVDYCVTRWGEEQFSKMSFSYIPTGVDGPKQLLAMGEAIRDPVIPEKPIIMFAGEHSTPHHPSTMHGAFLSGIREAYRYDLYFAPVLNDYMTFEATNQIYQHTFHMPRVYQPVKAASPKRSKPNGSPSKAVAKKTSAVVISVEPSTERERRSRRRGFGGMTLRKRPQMATTTSNTATTKKMAPKPASPPKVARRSPPPSEQAAARSPLTSKLDAASEADVRRSQRPSRKSHANGTSVDLLGMARQTNTPSQLEALEDRTLLRAVESYGWSNEELLCSKVVPVFGSSRKRDASQVRNRLHQLFSANKKTSSKAKAKAGKLLSNWKAKHAIKEKSKSGCDVPNASVVVARTIFLRAKTETTKGGMSLRRQVKRPDYLDV